MSTNATCSEVTSQLIHPLERLEFQPKTSLDGSTLPYASAPRSHATNYSSFTKDFRFNRARVKFLHYKEKWTPNLKALNSVTGSVQHLMVEQNTFKKNFQSFIGPSRSPNSYSSFCMEKLSRHHRRAENFTNYRKIDHENAET
ncbi:hypothetical protein CCR75_001682 [Bremia lactucae]|uniref:Uncharacterized protein n=1 Tax=Bremia lactucae TaxID=4779 RepID=A0A976FF29_BRELC|nr:hypothetical protein CCR75_001682 [Bremia lactucae]